MANQFCNDCSSYVELTSYGEKECSICNPQFMQEDDLTPLDFNDPVPQGMLDEEDEDAEQIS